MMKALFLTLWVGAVSGCSSSPMLGHWSFSHNNTKVGLVLEEQEECVLYTSPFLRPTSIRECNYRPYEDVYLVYLKNAEGVCNINADFEFRYNEEARTIDLWIDANPILLTPDPTEVDYSGFDL